MGQKATSKFDLPEFDPKSVNRDTPLLEQKGVRLIGDAPEVSLVLCNSRGFCIVGTGCPIWSETWVGSIKSAHLPG